MVPCIRSPWTSRKCRAHEAAFNPWRSREIYRRLWSVVDSSNCKQVLRMIAERRDSDAEPHYSSGDGAHSSICWPVFRECPNCCRSRCLAGVGAFFVGSHHPPHSDRPNERDHLWCALAPLFAVVPKCDMDSPVNVFLDISIYRPGSLDRSCPFVELVGHEFSGQVPCHKDPRKHALRLSPTDLECLTHVLCFS